jgi:lipopolysaccharide/colanic/teichoic acid biosynthesis glycosyltransferase
VRQRLFDLTLLFLCAPFLVVVIGGLALVAAIVDGRPIFFRQARLGRGRRTFYIWKLRSMSPEPDARLRRPTRFGGWMRERGLDEITQVLNVLLGDMSLVGPRPQTPADAERQIAQHPAFAARYALRPGITGLAQVSGARGIALTARLDAEYGRTRGAVVDLVILFRTLWINVVGKRRGARALPPEDGAR